MEDRRSHCREASLYKSRGRRKGTEYGYLLIVGVQIVVAWSVANEGGLRNAPIGPLRQTVAAFQTRFRSLRHVK
jgi:hypothetical protein